MEAVIAGVEPISLLPPKLCVRHCGPVHEAVQKAGHVHCPGDGPVPTVEVIPQTIKFYFNQRPESLNIFPVSQVPSGGRVAEVAGRLRRGQRARRQHQEARRRR